MEGVPPGVACSNESGWLACAIRERQRNMARDFLAPFRRDPSVSLPKFPVRFPSSAQRRDAKRFGLLEKSGAGGGNRTRDIQLGKLSFYH
jgi:hypothetical protein